MIAPSLTIAPWLLKTLYKKLFSTKAGIVNLKLPEFGLGSMLKVNISNSLILVDASSTPKSKNNVSSGTIPGVHGAGSEPELKTKLKS